MEYKPNTLIIYPSPTKKLNINEKQFITITNYIKSNNILLVEDMKLDDLENYKNISKISPCKIRPNKTQYFANSV